jgi:hypothetical protein
MVAYAPYDPYDPVKHPLITGSETPVSSGQIATQVEDPALAEFSVSR